jgi:hypothetical protein
MERIARFEENHDRHQRELAANPNQRSLHGSQPTGPPETRPGSAQTAQVDPAGDNQVERTPKLSSRVVVVNPLPSGLHRWRRKDAQHYVSVGRAVWVGPNRIRLVESHPKNRAVILEDAASFHRTVERRLTPTERLYTATARAEKKWKQNRRSRKTFAEDLTKAKPATTNTLVQRHYGKRQECEAGLPAGPTDDLGPTETPDHEQQPYRPAERPVTWSPPADLGAGLNHHPISFLQTHSYPRVTPGKCDAPCICPECQELAPKIGGLNAFVKNHLANEVSAGQRILLTTLPRARG